MIRDIDAINNPTVAFDFTRDECKITTNHETLKTVSTFSRQSVEVLGIMCNDASADVKYKSSFIKRLKYAVNNSEKISFRFNPEGHLCAQFFLAKVERGNIFVEFFVSIF